MSDLSSAAAATSELGHSRRTSRNGTIVHFRNAPISGRPKAAGRCPSPSLKAWTVRDSLLPRLDSERSQELLVIRRYWLDRFPRWGVALFAPVPFDRLTATTRPIGRWLKRGGARGARQT
jgi:hypothetical protein